MSKVVITGLGVITPIGLGIRDFWNSALEGSIGYGEIISFDTTDYRTHVGGEVKGFNPQDYIKTIDYSTIGRASQFAIAASIMAIEDAGLQIEKINKTRCGVAMGTTMGEIQEFDKMVSIRVKDGVGDIPGDLFFRYPCNVISASIANEFSICGQVITIPTACSAGNYSIAFAYDKIISGEADVMIAGGADAFSRMAFAGFNKLLSLSPDYCRPFDKNRKGLMVSEGAGILILESYEHAKRRNANIYAELIGYGLSCSAYHMTTPHPEGDGAFRSISSALKKSQISCEQVDYISAHGTGTPANDVAETVAVKRVFGPLAETIPMSSIKSMLGHCMGAASAIEAVACALMIKYGIVLPTVNYEEKDPNCDLDYVPNYPREKKVNVALSNAYAFGGNDSSIILRRF